MNPETLSIIQSICRIGLGHDSAAFRHQVQRLRDQFIEQGDSSEAGVIDKLLKASLRSMEMQPSRVTMSLAFAGVEELTRRTNAPVDKETGAALADIIFPEDQKLDFPILESNLNSATQSIVDEWRNIKLLSEAGVMPPTTCLFYGKPGTGKTRIALSMATQLGIPVVLTRLDGVISSFLGTTGRNVANLFSFANRYNCMLLLDEFDAIAKVRDDPHEVGEIKRVVNTILQNIDSRKNKGITVAITNHEQLLDDAVWRRFDVRIFFPAPAVEERLAIALRYFGPNELDELRARFVAWLSEGMTGADIEVMAKNIRRYRALNNGCSLVDALKRFSITQAGRNGLRHEMLRGENAPEVAREMTRSKDLNFTQKEIGEVLGVSQTQISRWVKN